MNKLLFYFMFAIAAGQQPSSNSSQPSTTLLSDLVDGISDEVAGVLDFGNDLGRKLYPPEAYDFAELAGRGLFFESVDRPLTQNERSRLQSIIDECPRNPPKAASQEFVTVQDSEFKLQGLTFQFLGFNSYQVVLEALQNPSAVDTLFSRAQNLGLKVTRVWLFSNEIRTGPFDWDERVFVALDRVIQKAAQFDIKIVFAFANFWEHFLGAEQYVWWAFGTLSGKTIEDFFVDSGVRLLYMSHVCKCINRVNTVTGVRWRDDPTIMAWNLMNEPRCPGSIRDGSRSVITTQWIRDMSQYIKSIDPNHLVTTGMEGFSAGGSSGLDNPGSWALCQGTDFIDGHRISSIDYATIHIYPEHNTWNYEGGVFCDVQCQIEWSEQYYQNRIKEATNILKKPLVLEEFGMSLKFKYRVSQPNGGFFEAFYSRSERVQMYQRLLSTMLSAIQRGERADGLMFWMAITNSYPDYDGFSILIDDSVSFEGINPPDYNVLLQFRQQAEVEQCISENSNWVPNRINPEPTPVTVQGSDVSSLLFDAFQKLGGVSTPGPAPVPPTSSPSVPTPTPGCTDIPPSDAFSCEQQEEFGKCSESWMLNGDFCKKTCGRCDTTCTDVPPDNKFSCAQQSAFGKCDESWMLGGDFCKNTCGRCDTTCTDVRPDNEFTCEQRLSWGGCQQDWMLSGDFCKLTCGRC